MISNRRKRNGLELGYDSFLDIVANLVGILINPIWDLYQPH